MQFIIIKELNNCPYYWDGRRFTSYAPNQIAFASRADAADAIAAHHMGSLAFIRELD